jgi:hypothetical protein
MKVKFSPMFVDKCKILFYIILILRSIVTIDKKYASDLNMVLC